MGKRYFNEIRTMASPEKDINGILWQHLRLSSGKDFLWKWWLSLNVKTEKRVGKWIGERVQWVGHFIQRKEHVPSSPQLIRHKLWTTRLILSPKNHCLPTILNFHCCVFHLVLLCHYPNMQVLWTECLCFICVLSWTEYFILSVMEWYNEK